MPTETNQRRDARAIAKLLISRYGEQSISYASHQALRARERGDTRMMEAWRWIAGAIHEVLRAEPDDDEAQQEQS